MDQGHVKFGIIGCSDIAKRVTVPALMASRHASLFMLGSRSSEKAREWSHLFRCENYGTYQDVLDNPQLDAVYISLPIGLQAEWSMRAAQAGKHIICEKSATTSYAAAQRVVAEARTHHVRILEGLMFRFHPQHAKVMDLIQEGFVGAPYCFEGKFGLTFQDRQSFRFQRALGGGALNDTGCYPVCASRFLLQSEPLGAMANLVHEEPGEVDVRGSFYLLFPENRVAFGSFGYTHYYQSTYSLWGSRGIIRLQRAYAIKPDMETTIWAESDAKSLELKISPANQSQRMIDEFCQVVRGEGKASFSYEEGLLSQAKVMEAIRFSSREKRFVHLCEVTENPVPVNEAVILPPH